MYYRPTANGVLYDATIQGSLFGSHPSAGSDEITLDKEPFLFGNQLGLSYATSRVVLDLSVVVQTHDTEQIKRATHQWGAVGLSYLFN